MLASTSDNTEFRRVGKNSEEIRQEDRGASAFAIHPESVGAAIFHNRFDLKAGEGV